MPFSASSVYSSALTNSRTFPGGRPILEKGGTFQPTTNEKIAIARASADDQFDAGFLEQFRGAMQNRLNMITGQLQQAYNGLLQATSAAFVADGLGATENKFVWNGSKGNGYLNYATAFAGIGNDANKDGIDDRADVDGDGKHELADANVPIYAAITGQGGAGSVRMRAFSEHGAALDIKQKIGITMRSEESNDQNPVLAILTPGLNQKVKEYETTVSTGGFWSGINYLYAWRPSQMQYSYVDGYSQNSDAAGFKGYLSQGKNTSADAGDGSLTGQSNQSKIKWQGGGFGEGYLATSNGDLLGGATADDGPTLRSDVGNDGNAGNDDLRFANTYYVHQRSVEVSAAAYNVNTFAANGAGANDGVISQVSQTVLNNRTNGLGYFDTVNGNNFRDPKSNEIMPGSGKIDETFNGNWIGKQIEITSFNGTTVNGNANAPIFGNFELARFQTYQAPDETLNVNEDRNADGILQATEDDNGNGSLDRTYVNGYNIDVHETNKARRLGQLRQFTSSTGTIIREVDQRAQDQNSLSELIMEIMRKPAYKDIFRLGLFKDVVIQGGANAPAGGVVNATLRLSYVPSPVWADAVLVPGKGVRPGIRGEMIVFQDKYMAKGA
ncbi:MAG: hypothetical protein H7338_24015 [Candidatus Sericytochromatia bacterium]|nr:hypothetical protein [Candidatus Sericytochromatia bacterium]